MHQLLTFLYQFSLQRKSWLILLLSCLALELTALYFQYGMDLSPCVYCIYQRCALFGIGIMAIVGLSYPRSLIIRFIALIGWTYSAYAGLQFAITHTNIQLNPSPFQQCPLFVNFPSWFPLNTWFPTVFDAYGDCAEKQWSFLSLEMPQWMIFIFGVYLIIALFVVLAQFIPLSTRQKKK